MLSLLRNDDRVFALQPFHIWNLRTCALTDGRIGHTCQTGRTRHDRRAIAISEIRARLLVKVLSMPQAIYDVWYQLANDEHVGEEMGLRRLSEQDAQFELGPAPSEEDALMSLVDEELAYSQMFASLEDQSTRQRNRLPALGEVVGGEEEGGEGAFAPPFGTSGGEAKDSSEGEGEGRGGGGSEC